jgi:hypothetical protein
MAEMLQQCNGLALPEHGNELDLATYDYCMAEMKLQLHEFDLISLKLVGKPDELTKLGFKQEHATAIVSAGHEHIAAEAGAKMATALARLRQADVEIDAELLAPRLRRRRRRWWRRQEGAQLLAPRIVWQPRVPFLTPVPDPCCCSSDRRPDTPAVCVHRCRSTVYCTYCRRYITLPFH